MILLFTDFGHEGPYAGELRAALARTAPEVPIIDLMYDAPAHDPRRAAYLLAHLSRRSQPGEVWLAVVDPGVGGDRPPVICEIDGVWMVGPENGLFEIARRRAASARCWRIGWRPKMLSETFHGRDLFAPVAARLALGATLDDPGIAGAELTATEFAGADWPDELDEIIHIDRFGNLITGLDSATVDPNRQLRVGDEILPHARTFSESAEGALFWYVNSAGLVEISANRASAVERLGAILGDMVAFEGEYGL